jgi:hypothetical protein
MEGIGAPLVLRGTTMVEDLAVELTCGPYASASSKP